MENRKKQYLIEYDRWLKNADADDDLIPALRNMREGEIEDSFYRDLSFGTGGLRGTIGPGTNRLNIYTVAKASQGVSEYLKKNADQPSVVIGYDSRIKSELFAKVAAGVFTANKIKVYLWPELIPVPAVSFAVRYLNASAGVMITASHNPSEYNGYKVYAADGCQITTETASEIQNEIQKVDCFRVVINTAPVTEMVTGEVLDAYVREVKKQSVLFRERINRDVAIVYSPLNGTGLKLVTRVLKETGFTNITIVSEQEYPDGAFPTCPYPNPEVKEAMELGLRYCKRLGADLLLATDPDCDRCGIAVKDGNSYSLLTGNEVGLLMLDFVCAQRTKHGYMPKEPVFMKTIVTTDLAERIAAQYGVRTVNVLTGFKFIGEQIGFLEEKGRADRFICGFEESYGYLTGSYVRDKDGVNAALIICEMFAYYKTHDIGLMDKLRDIYRTYGFCMNTQHSYSFKGAEGAMRMRVIMKRLRSGIESIGGLKVLHTTDYACGIDGLPKADVLKFNLEDHCSVVIRPSGTEPKMKTYISIIADSTEKAKAIENSVETQLQSVFQ